MSKDIQRPKYSVGMQVRIDPWFLPFPTKKLGNIGTIVQTPRVSNGFSSYLVFFDEYNSMLHTGEGFGIDGHYWFVPEDAIKGEVENIKNMPEDSFWLGE